MEELNYALKTPRLVLVQEFEIEGEIKRKHIYMEEYDLNKELKLLEGQGMDWFNPAETSHLKMTDDDREVLKKIDGKY